MKVSIITVCRNAEDSIEESIQSVVCQNFPDIEHIIIDGNSTDNTNNIIEKYSDKIAYYISEPDTGVYNAMNKGIKASTGEILYFLNANDYLFDENVISDVVKEFEKTKSEIIWGKLANVLSNGDIEYPNQDDSFEYPLNKLYFLAGNNMCHQCIFYNSKLFEKYGLYDESLKIAADFDFNLKALVKNKTQYSMFNRTVVKFSIGGFSTSEKYRYLLLEERKIVINRYFSKKEISTNKLLNKTFRSIIKNKYLKKLLCYLLNLNL